MTEADKALLYAREHWETISEEHGFPEVAEAYRRGVKDEVLATDALFYRAGAAASAERIKELEARVAELEAALQRLVNASEPVEEYTHEVAIELEEAIKTAELVLKESDQ